MNFNSLQVLGLALKLNSFGKLQIIAQSKLKPKRGNKTDRFRAETYKKG